MQQLLFRVLRVGGEVEGRYQVQQSLSRVGGEQCIRAPQAAAAVIVAFVYNCS